MTSWPLTLTFSYVILSGRVFSSSRDRGDPILIIKLNRSRHVRPIRPAEFQEGHPVAKGNSLKQVSFTKRWRGRRTPRRVHRDNATFTRSRSEKAFPVWDPCNGVLH